MFSDSKIISSKTIAALAIVIQCPTMVFSATERRRLPSSNPFVKSRWNVLKSKNEGFDNKKRRERMKIATRDETGADSPERKPVESLRGLGLVTRPDLRRQNANNFAMKPTFLDPKFVDCTSASHDGNKARVTFLNAIKDTKTSRQRARLPNFEPFQRAKNGLSLEPDYISLDPMIPGLEFEDEKDFGNTQPTDCSEDEKSQNSEASGISVQRAAMPPLALICTGALGATVLFSFQEAAIGTYVTMFALPFIMILIGLGIWSSCGKHKMIGKTSFLSIVIGSGILGAGSSVGVLYLVKGSTPNFDDQLSSTANIAVPCLVLGLIIFLIFYHQVMRLKKPLSCY